MTMVNIMSHYESFEPIRRAIETPKIGAAEHQMQKQTCATRKIMLQLSDLRASVKQQVPRREFAGI